MNGKSTFNHPHLRNISNFKCFKAANDMNISHEMMAQCDHTDYILPQQGVVECIT